MSEEEIKDLVLEFHNTYEELSTNYGYETRKDTRKFDFNSPNGKLMYATIEKVVVPKLQQKENIIKEAKDYIDKYLEREYFDTDILENNTIYNRDLFKVKQILDKEVN